MTIQNCIFHDNGKEDIHFIGGHMGDPESRIENCRFHNAADDTTAAIRFKTCRVAISGATGDDNTFILLDHPIGEVDEDLHLTYPGTLDGGGSIPYFLSDRWTISAVPVSGVTFDGWTLVGGNAIFGDPTAQETTVTLLEDCVVEAKFSGTPSCFQETYDARAAGHGLTPGSDGTHDPENDSSGNGVSDVVAFAMGLDPKSPELPDIPVSYAGGAFHMTYQEALEAAGAVDCVIEGSKDLETFTPVPEACLDESRTNQGTVDLVTCAIRCSEFRYFRIRIDY